MTCSVRTDRSCLPITGPAGRAGILGGSGDTSHDANFGELSSPGALSLPGLQHMLRGAGASASSVVLTKLLPQVHVPACVPT